MVKTLEKYYLEANDTLLLVVDVQERLAPAIDQAENVIRQNIIMIKAANIFGLPILLTEQYPKGLGPTLTQITEILPQTAFVSEKISFDAYTPAISEALKTNARKKIIVTGMETHVCVFQTVRHLLDEGYHVFLATDATGSRTKTNKKNALVMMEAMGAVISNTETLLFDLQKTARNAQFKQISTLIK